MSEKVALLIMDGWGHGLQPDRSAIAAAKVPFINSLYQKYPHTELLTHGEDVGLPAGQMGNSEVGHLNIGAGRVVFQELLRINKAIRSGELAENKTLQETFDYCKKSGKPLHLAGLVSDGGVHSHIEHLKALCTLAAENGLTSNQIRIHAFTDGRDTDPKSGLGYIADLELHLSKTGGAIATLCGRYYAMDRDNRWERIQIAYNAMVLGQGSATTNITAGIAASYANGVTDEFILPLIQTNAAGEPIGLIEEGDAVLCFNFRTDRCREIVKALTQQDFPEFGMKKLDIRLATMTMYDHSFAGIPVLFQVLDLSMPLGEVLAQHHITQLRAAETEKYPHVTFFFNGGRETPFEGEARIMEPSPKVATYDLQPEMSAGPLTKKVIAYLQEQQPGFVCLNYANADMVGHTGIFPAVVKAVETVSSCVEKVVDACLELGYVVLLTADHGNADYMINDDGTPNTAHTMNLVPLFLIGMKQKVQLHPGRLADIAPTVLKIMGIEAPAQMTGTPLF
ncbi:MAG: 2,3-bisphosphoglycerate-independent phosphoglycerate mutase [Chitinophagales bacterium]